MIPAASAVWPASRTRHRTPAWRSVRLANGGLAHTADLPHHNLAAARLILRPGGDPAPSGLPLVLAHALLQGTVSHALPEFNSRLESTGARVSVTAAPEAVCIDLIVPLARLEPATELLGEAVSAPALTDEGIRQATFRQRAVVEGDLHRPVTVVTDRFRRYVFAGAGDFERPPGGTLASLDALRPDEVRALYLSTVSPARIGIVAAGDGTSGRLDKVLAGALGQWVPAACSAPGGTVPAVLVPPPDPAIRAAIELEQTSQAAVACGRVVTVATETEVAALAAVVHLLGGWFCARLPRVLREEKGYTYGITAAFQTWRTAQGHVGEILIRSSFGTPVLGRAVTELLDQVSRVAAGDFSADEWRQSVQNLTRSRLLGMQTAAHLVASHAPYVQRGYGIGAPDRFAALAERLDLDLVRRVAAEQLDVRRFTIVAGGDADAIRTGLAGLDGLDDQVPR